MANGRWVVPERSNENRSRGRSPGMLVALPLCVSLVTGSFATLVPGRAAAQAPTAPASSVPGRPNPAPANATAVQRADAAFEEGRTFFDQGRYKEACEKFELSMQLDPSPGTLLNLGNCYEPQGDLVRALDAFERAFADAQRASDARRKELWTEAARERIASLSRRVPQLSVRGVPADGRVSIDRHPIERSGVLRINPGRHGIEVSAPGKRAFTRDFQIASGQRLAINVPELEVDLAPAASSTTPPAQQASSPGDDADGKKYGPWPYVLGSAGVVLLGTSLITGLNAKFKQNKLERDCDENKVCDRSLKSTQDSARTLAALTDVFWITGLVAAGAGVTLFVLDASAGGSGAAVEAGCFDSGCGLLANGRF
jgi:tetratricopeptide (TPR) repeat protein